ncbi:MAG: hypothetical protein Q9170_006192 [Blastenia crenularia]
MEIRIHTFFLLFVSLSWIALIAARPNNVFPHIGHSTGLLRSSNHGRFDQSGDASRPTASVSKRTLHPNRFAVNTYVGLGWYCYFNLLDMIRPFDPVASDTLEQFFTDVLSLGGAVWAHEPAETYRAARLGQMALKITSSDPIQWEWIRQYLVGAIWWTRAGFAANYKTTYRNEVNGVWLIVELILPLPPGAASAARKRLKV